MRLGWLIAPRRMQRRPARRQARQRPGQSGAAAAGAGPAAGHRRLRTAPAQRPDPAAPPPGRAARRAARAPAAGPVEGVAAGLHLLITLPGGTAGGHRAAPSGSRRAGVLVHPLSWHRQPPGPPGLVLGYAAHTPDRLPEAAGRIARALAVEHVAGTTDVRKERTARRCAAAARRSGRTRSRACRPATDRSRTRSWNGAPPTRSAIRASTTKPPLQYAKAPAGTSPGTVEHRQELRGGGQFVHRHRHHVVSDRVARPPRRGRSGWAG